MLLRRADEVQVEHGQAAAEVLARAEPHLDAVLGLARGNDESNVATELRHRLDEIQVGARVEAAIRARQPMAAATKTPRLLVEAK